MWCYGDGAAGICRGVFCGDGEGCVYILKLVVYVEVGMFW